MRDIQGEHATLGEMRAVDLAEVDVVLLRQDPPFDLAYVTTTHLLERIHPATLVVNDPRAVRDAPEKLFVMDFPELMPPTLISRDRAAIEAFRAEQREVVMKPLYGHGGAAVFKVGPNDPNFGSIFDLFSATFREPWVIQKFLPQVAQGDKRIILVDGEALGAVNRVPVGDDIRSNMVRGGAARRNRADGAGTGDLRPHRAGTEASRPAVRRHRRDRRPFDRDQRDLADRPARHQAPRRPRSRRRDLGRHRGQAPVRLILKASALIELHPPAALVLKASAMESASVQSSPPARSRRSAAAPKRGDERARLDAEISPPCAARSPTTRASGRRRSPLSRAALEEGRAEARRVLEEGGKGLACAARISDLEDEIIGAIHDLALRVVRSGQTVRRRRAA